MMSWLMLKKQMFLSGIINLSNANKINKTHSTKNVLWLISIEASSLSVIFPHYWYKSNKNNYCIRNMINIKITVTVKEIS